MNEIKIIKLSNGNRVIVDAEDFDYLSQWKWHHYTGGYAARTKRTGDRIRQYLMHRIVNNTPPDMKTDHINRNKSDNRKCNLRTCTPSQNNFNKNISKKNTSGFIGVYFDKGRGKWKAKIGRLPIGFYRYKANAIKARHKAELMFNLT